MYSTSTMTTILLLDNEDDADMHDWTTVVRKRTRKSRASSALDGCILLIGLPYYIVCYETCSSIARDITLLTLPDGDGLTSTNMVNIG
jgi:hypothetical protein